MGKVTGLLVVLAVVAAVAYWAGVDGSHAIDEPSPAQAKDINALVQRCAHVPQDQMDACTMREYAKIHGH